MVRGFGKIVVLVGGAKGLRMKPQGEGVKQKEGDNESLVNDDSVDQINLEDINLYEDVISDEDFVDVNEFDKSEGKRIVVVKNEKSPLVMNSKWKADADSNLPEIEYDGVPNLPLAVSGSINPWPVGDQSDVGHHAIASTSVPNPTSIFPNPKNDPHEFGHCKENQKFEFRFELRKTETLTKFDVREKTIEFCDLTGVNWTDIDLEPEKLYSKRDRSSIASAETIVMDEDDTKDHNSQSLEQFFSSATEVFLFEYDYSKTWFHAAHTAIVVCTPKRKCTELAFGFNGFLRKSTWVEAKLANFRGNMPRRIWKLFKSPTKSAKVKDLHSVVKDLEATFKSYSIWKMNCNTWSSRVISEWLVKINGGGYLDKLTIFHNVHSFYTKKKKFTSYWTKLAKHITWFWLGAVPPEVKEFSKLAKLEPFREYHSIWQEMKSKQAEMLQIIHKSFLQEENTINTTDPIKHLTQSHYDTFNTMTTINNPSKDLLEKIMVFVENDEWQKEIKLVNTSEITRSSSADAISKARKELEKDINKAKIEVSEKYFWEKKKKDLEKKRKDWEKKVKGWEKQMKDSEKKRNLV